MWKSPALDGNEKRTNMFINCNWIPNYCSMNSWLLFEWHDTHLGPNNGTKSHKITTFKDIFNQ